MGSIGWDIVRTTLGAFLLIRLSLTALVRFATALRGLDLVTRPSLVMIKRARVMAPIAMALAAHFVYALATDCAAMTGRLTRRLATM